MAIWQGAITLSAVFGGPFAASILETMGGIANLPSWKWFLLIEGAISIFVGVASYWFLPNWTNNTPWLTLEETEMAQYRIVKSAGGIDEMQGDYTLFQGAKLAAKDPFTWLFAALHFFLIVGQAYKEFLPSILHTFGESKLTTYLLQSPCYFLGYLATLGVGWSSGRFKEFTYHTAVPLVLSIVGVAMMISTENIGVRYTGICFLIMGTASGLNMQVSWETTVIPSPRHKKAAVIAIANICKSIPVAFQIVDRTDHPSMYTVSSTSHWFSPYFFLRNQEPLYRLAGGLLLVGCGASILSVLAVRWRVNRLNKVLDSQNDVENEQRRERGQADKSQAWRFPI
ncbi:hypothetical protein FFLO_06517 [Filobasidium floriforme]|uniref:Uncharacterized protein n=2 Tax=Filobasidium floriforme TaxID=5210 RepID=A0A8K0JF86_9TREE|nr:hypothetical protein FFLO_06517 [Filobasidium floriforme]